MAKKISKALHLAAFIYGIWLAVNGCPTTGILMAIVSVY